MGLLLNLTADDTKSATNVKPPQPEKRKKASKPQASIPQTSKPQSVRPAAGPKAAPVSNLSSSLFTGNPSIPNLTPSSTATSEPVEVFEKASFDTLDISPNIKGNLRTEFKCPTMTRVQKEAIPRILSRRDVQVKSPTGSGKTLAYAVPLLHRLQDLQPAIGRADGLYAVVILPTRELALQTYEVFSKLCRAHVRIVPGMLAGGEKKKSEKARLRKGVNILISTPGRMADHLSSTSCLSLERTQILVLDESDKLIEMGFMKDIRQIVTKCRQGKAIRPQTILLSATITPGVEDLSELSLQDPELIDTGGGGEDAGTFSVPDTLAQHFVLLPTKLRLVTLLSFLAEKRTKKVIVFVSCKDSVQFHYEIASAVFTRYFPEESFTLLRLHGSMEQSERVPVYSKFRSCSAGILFTTDVAARGLDLPEVSWIVQYDGAGSVKDYVHRVGRTARAGTAGKALLFLHPSEEEYVGVLRAERIQIKQAKHERCLKKLTEFTEAKRPEDAASEVQRFVENHCKEREAKGVSIRAFQSYVRSYKTSFMKDKFADLHLGHVAKTFGLSEAPSAFLHKNLTRKKQVAARKEHLFEREEKKYPAEGEKKKKKKRKLNLVSDNDMAGFALLAGPQPKKAK